ncbi:hypothetical protein [Cytobacillus firmus]|uniref:hypothetical protein n=1 Tax=Cytobacillus firmus TaxID=1399 RepID=UPI0034A43F17
MEKDELRFDFERYKNFRKKDLTSSYKDFLKITDHDDLLIIVLRGHLYIEREINNLLKKVYKDEQYRNLLFSQKVDLCKSLGLIDSDRIPPLNKLNKHRNGYAHNLDFKIEEKDYEDLLSTLSKEAKDQFEIELDGFYKLNQEKEKSLTNNYRVLLAAIWAELRIQNIYFFYNFQIRTKQIIEAEGIRIRESSELD